MVYRSSGGEREPEWRKLSTRTAAIVFVLAAAIISAITMSTRPHLFGSVRTANRQQKQIHHNAASLEHYKAVQAVLRADQNEKKELRGLELGAEDGEVWKLSKAAKTQKSKMHEPVSASKVILDESEKIRSIFERMEKGPHMDTRVSGTGTKFVPYPHNSMPHTMHGKFVVGAPAPEMDTIQKAAMKETYFLNSADGKVPPLHQFSTKEARECLQDRKVLVTGDSYIKQFYVGLADILLARPDNENLGFPLHGPVYRHNTMLSLFHELKALGAGFERIMPACMGDHFQCYGLNKDGPKPDQNSLDACIKCLHQPKFRQADAIVVSSSVHLMESRGFKGHISNGEDFGGGNAAFNAKVARNVVHDIKSLWNEVDNIIWATGPQTREFLVPGQVKEKIDVNGLDYVFDHTCGPKAEGKVPPCMDFYHLTGACPHQNCTYDGSHFQRFVNRQKANVFLNIVCSRDSRKTRASTKTDLNQTK